MKKIKIIILNRLIKHLYNGITEDDILTQKGTNLVVGGSPLSNQAVQTLKSDAEWIKNMELWKLMTKCMKYEANKMMYEKSTNCDDMIFGKAVLWTIDVMEKKVNKIAKL